MEQHHRIKHHILQKILADGQKPKFCKNFHNALLCKDCKDCKTCQNLQKTDKNCKRHKGCPNCYLVKNHGVEMENNISKILKEAIHRIGWQNLMCNDGTAEETTDKGHPSQGTVGPLKGELIALNPKRKEK